MIAAGYNTRTPLNNTTLQRAGHLATVNYPVNN